MKEEHIERVYTLSKPGFSGAKELRKQGIGRSTNKGGGSKEKFVVLSESREVVQDSIGTHGLMFTLRIPGLARWTKIGRRLYLKNQGMSFTPLKYGERLDTTLTLDWKVQLFERSLVLYAPKGRRWYGVDAHTSFSEGFFEALRVIKIVEGLLRVDLSFSGRYKIKPSREHHALIGNALAEQYTRAGEKLYVRDSRGLWALIDASAGPEFETVRAGVDARDANVRVQDFFNGVKETGLTPQMVLSAISGLTANAEVFGEHMKTHVKVMNEISVLIAGLNREKKK